MEETTTGAPIEGGVEASTQPVQEGQQAAAQPQEPQPQGQPAEADQTVAWLQSKGVDINDPEAIRKVAEMAYNSEKQMTKAAQEASELRKSLGTEPVVTQPGTDPSMQEFIQDYRRDKLINNFKSTHDDWSQHEPAMVAKLEEEVPTPAGVYTRSQLVNAGFYSLDDIYAMAKGSAPVDTTQIKTRAQQEVLQTLANTQRAGGSNAHASNSNPQAPQTDPVMEGIRRSRAS